MSSVNDYLFASFSKSIEGLPTERILGMIEFQHRMLEDDLAKQRVLPEDAVPLMAFFRFIDGFVGDGKIQAMPTQIQAKQLEFYRATVTRLVAAGELPPQANTYFDWAFSIGKASGEAER